MADSPRVHSHADFPFRITFYPRWRCPGISGSCSSYPLSAIRDRKGIPRGCPLPFMIYPPTLVRLIEALRCLPGVGPKSAQRMAFHLLEKDRNGAASIAEALQKAVAGIGRCQRCRMFAEADFCPICASASRDRSLLCVV